ncbi:MAG: S9 family peptidase [Myxococcales bacterium]|nr:S9 family peptidase [Myxococcales bacterium]
MRHPATRAEDVKDTLFGVAVADPYRWLEDGKAPEVTAWMEAQDQVTRARLAALPGRAALAARLKALFYVDSISAPRHRGTRYFYQRTHADREKAIYYWREGETGAEHVLLDPNTMSADGTTSVGLVVISHDGKSAAYTLKVNNSDESTLHVLEVATGVVSAIDVIPGAKYAHPSWTPDGRGFYYTRLPTDAKIPVADRPGFAEIRYHRLGTDPEKDPLIHERTGSAKTFLGVELSRDGHWLFVYVQHGWNSTDVYYRDTRAKSAAWKPFVVGKEAQYRALAWHDRFYIHTNEGAPRWRLLRGEAKRPARSDWKEIVAESEATLDGVEVIGEHLVLTWMRSAASELEVRTLDGKPVRKVPLPGLGATQGITGDPDQDEGYFAFTSFTHPLQVWKTSIKSGETKLWAAVKLPIDPSPYTVEQVFYPSKDGTKISMFLVHRKNLPKDGSTPFLLTGYGGFNVSMLPSFSSGLYPWLEAGGGFAMPNLRGGGEYGEDWHKAGMLARKQNVFDDFIGAAEFLISNHYTRPGKLAIRGGSNGGLLVGAVTTQRPDLFRAVVCQVPLLDMVRYHLFGSGKTWVPEYGTAEEEAGFKTLLAYSPYHHVTPGTAYPAWLMMSADSDDRVDPMHARKMAASLQAATTSDHPVLLRVEKHAGHGGADLVKQTVEMVADYYAFLMSELGLAAPK